MKLPVEKSVYIRSLLLLILQLQIYACTAKKYNADDYKDPHYAEGRTTMVHLFEWKWEDIAKECETFLGPMGYGGVQVSPISENLVIKGRPWFERYQPVSYKIATRSGNEKQFRDMVRRCNKVGVRIYVDAVINHMTGDGENVVGTGGSKAYPPRYPAVPYGPKDFNLPRCGIDYSNATSIRDCEMVGMHDLNQGRAHVRSKIVAFFNKAVSHGVAGFRIDAAKHMWPKNLEAIYSKINNLKPSVYGTKKRPFIFQEVISFFTNEPANKFQYNNLSTVIDFVFGASLGRIFGGQQPLASLENWGTQENGLLPSKDALVMIDNHDNQRGHGGGGSTILTYKEPKQYKMAVAFMLAHPYGHPRVMSSFNFSDPNSAPPADDNENLLSPSPISGNVAAGHVADHCGHGWVCEHRWRQIYNMVGFRNVAGSDASLANWWSNGNNQIAFSRGSRAFIAFNGEAGNDLNQTLSTGLPCGKYCDIISGSKTNGNCTGKLVVVDVDGKADIQILKDAEDGVLAIHVGSKL
ncbi:alpha-amylase 2-like [Trichogramma pretiosum]|uniref:alpha-amylase 2-like n=1 Tax=Trichogramma pretiosum TaxID=7493 RepID=UPI0006C983E9|nr:alpha-amylase 2-like [Trichogramma pretiosum]